MTPNMFLLALSPNLVGHQAGLSASDFCKQLIALPQPAW